MDPRRSVMWTTVVVLSISASAACSTSPVMLRHPVTEVTAQCGPYLIMNPFFPAISGTHEQERHCIEDFQRQGFERVPVTTTTKTP